MNDQYTGLRRFGVAFLVVTVLLTGAGCFNRKKAEAPASNPPQNQETGSLDLRDGSAFLVTQTVFPFEGRFETVEPSHNTRKVQIGSYAPAGSSNLAWELNRLVVTDESRAEKKAYEDAGSVGEAPKTKYGQIIEGGTMSGIAFQRTHDLLLPAGWEGGNRETRTSAMWLSDDVYQELSRTRSSTIYLRPLEAVRPLVAGNASLEKLVIDLQQRVQAIADRTDADLVKAEEQRVQYAVKVGGKETTVSAIKAKNWYGELIVLEHPRNPIVLQFDFNPPLDGVTAKPEDVAVLKGLLSYKVMEMNP